MSEAKRAAALAAVRLVEDGMVLGLGTGSTAKLFVDALGERARAEGLRVMGDINVVRDFPYVFPL